MFHGRIALCLTLSHAGCYKPCGPGFDVFSEPTAHEDEGFLFSWERINRVEITVDEDAARILAAERIYSQPRNKVRATVEIDGERLDDVGVRLRGGFGSFQPFRAKPKWELDFNEFVGDQRFVGLKSLSLNNADQDPSYLRDAAGFAVYAAAGLPAPRTGFAQLFVNGEDRGLYSVVETADDEWLESAFGDDAGRLYDGTYASVGQSVKFVDFGLGHDELFDLEEGDPVRYADIMAVSQAVLASEAAGRVSEELAALVDLDAVHRLWAVEQWLGNSDAYTTFRNNYRVYFPPDGPAILTPWDMDGTFDLAHDDERWQESRGRIVEICRLDNDCLARHAEIVAEVTAAIDAAELEVALEAVAALTATAAEDDPRGVCDPAMVRAEREHVLGWFRTASEDLLGEW